MDSKQLSKRLSAVAQYVPKGGRLLDVGSDHAYLPAYLAAHHVIDYGIASEVARGPFTNTKEEIKSSGLESILEPRLANGLKAITLSDRVNVITIAGMGGPLIRNILNDGKTKLANHPLLILQPNVDAYVLRAWLMNHNYQLIHESIVDDRHEIYEIMVAKWTSHNVNYDKPQLFFGPILLEKKNNAFIKKWRDELHHLQLVIQQMNKSSKPPIERIRQIKKCCQFIKKAL